MSSWLRKQRSSSKDEGQQPSDGLGITKNKTARQTSESVNGKDDNDEKPTEKSAFNKQMRRGLFKRRKSQDKERSHTSSKSSASCDSSGSSTFYTHEESSELVSSKEDTSSYTTSDDQIRNDSHLDNSQDHGDSIQKHDATHSDLHTAATSTKKYPLVREKGVDEVVTTDDEGFEEYHLDETDLTPEPEPSSPSKGESRVQHICEELLATEETYVAKLGHIFEITKQTAGALGDQVSHKLFPNIKPVYELHHDNLLPALRERVKNWHSGSRLGDIMCRLTPFLKLYTEYVKNFQATTQLVHSWRDKSATFNKILKQYPMSIPGQLGIDALMIEPVQRVPRYKLLLSDYLKHLPEHSEDIPDVKKALEQVSNAAEHFESMIRRDAQLETLSELQASLVGGRNIFSLSRNLLRKFVVYQINKRTGEREECTLYLFNDILLITVEIAGFNYSLAGFAGLMMDAAKKQRTKHLMDLTKIKVNMGSNTDLPFGLDISTRSVMVQIGMRNSTEMSELKELLHAQMADTTKKKAIRRGTWSNIKLTKKLSLGDKPPTFVPPHTVSVCMCCGEQFLSQRKKKHCGACGMVVCGKCSMHKENLSYDTTSGPQRVCLNCFAIFEKHRMPITIT